MSAERYAYRAVYQPRRIYGAGDDCVPVPPLLADLVRDEGHWARVLSHIVQNAPFLGKRGMKQPGPHHECMRLAASGQMHTPQFADIVQQIVPTRCCRQCGKRYLAVHEKARYCTDRCKRLAEYRGYKEAPHA